MGFLVPLTIFGWFPLTLVFFEKVDVQKASLFSILGGVLFLPMAQYDLPLLPAITKITAISMSLFFSMLVFGLQNKNPFRYSVYDLPIILWCFVTPLATALRNSLGLHHGFAGVMVHFFTWGLYYMVGRRFFSDRKGLRRISKAIIIGGLLYAPLCLYEIRMSPQLSRQIYGFFPHSFLQHVRYGGFRPIVFMQHGLMVSLWMSVSYMTSLVHWAEGSIRKIWKIPMIYIVPVLLVVTILCKSANGWISVLFGTMIYLFYRWTGSAFGLRILLLIVPAYMAVRISNVITIDFIQRMVGMIFDENRVNSLGIRLVQENLFGMKALEHPWFGWGGFNRSWPIDPLTGERLVRMVDSLFVITSGQFGYFGLAGLFLSLLVGPLLALKMISKGKGKKAAERRQYPVDLIPLSFVCIIFAVDCLMNGMVNPVYIFVSGALVGFVRNEKDLESVVESDENVG